MGSLPSIFMSLAILVAYVIGSLVNWNILAWYCSVMSAVYGILLFLMPESPVWLRSKNRFKEAEQSTAWLKLPPPSMVIPQKTDLEMIALGKNGEKIKPKSIYFTRPIVMPLIIGLSLLVLQQVSGIDAVIFFTVEIFRQSGEYLLILTKIV